MSSFFLAVNIFQNHVLLPCSFANTFLFFLEFSKCLNEKFFLRVSFSQPRDFHGMSVKFILDFFDISMVCLLDFYGIPMEFP